MSKWEILPWAKIYSIARKQYCWSVCEMARRHSHLMLMLYQRSLSPETLPPSPKTVFRSKSYFPTQSRFVLNLSWQGMTYIDQTKEFPFSSPVCNVHGQEAVCILKGFCRLALEGSRSLRTMVRWFLVCLPRANMLLARHWYEAWWTKAQEPVLKDDVTFDLH